MVRNIGYTPFKVTHASDYFQELYEFAKVLIEGGLAYVCHQTADQMKGFETEASPWRDRSVDLNLQLFEVWLNVKKRCQYETNVLILIKGYESWKV